MGIEDRLIFVQGGVWEVSEMDKHIKGKDFQL